VATSDDVFVLDASVLVELVGDGRHRDGADALLDRLMDASPPAIVTAPHGLLEALNALRRLEAGGGLAPEAARGAAVDLTRLPLVVDDTGPRVPRIWSLRASMTTYDAAYAAAAAELEAPLLTVDGRLLRACRANGVPALHLDELASV
jgi:predicted nucleic acid-binding protein